MQHVKTKKHIERKAEKDIILEEIQNEIPEQEVPEEEPEPHENCSFNRDLCKALLSADIPLNKLSNKTFRDFLEKYAGKCIPDQSTVRKYLVQQIYNASAKKLQTKVADEKIWVSLDETTDVEQRSVASLVCRIMDDEQERTKCYLGNMTELEKVNHSTIAAFFNYSLNMMWSRQILYKNVLVVTTDAAPYMCKAMRGLQVLFPKMVHVTCLAHGLHRVAE